MFFLPVSISARRYSTFYYLFEHYRQLRRRFLPIKKPRWIAGLNLLYDPSNL
jgi:hypothetical protein